MAKLKRWSARHWLQMDAWWGGQVTQDMQKYIRGHSMCRREERNDQEGIQKFSYEASLTCATRIATACVRHELLIIKGGGPIRWGEEIAAPASKRCTVFEWARKCQDQISSRHSERHHRNKFWCILCQRNRNEEPKRIPDVCERSENQRWSCKMLPDWVPFNKDQPSSQINYGSRISSA